MPTFLFIDEMLPNVFVSVSRRPYGGEVREFATTSDLQTDMLWRRNLFIYLFICLFIYVVYMLHPPLLFSFCMYSLLLQHYTQQTNLSKNVMKYYICRIALYGA